MLLDVRLEIFGDENLKIINEARELEPYREFEASNGRSLALATEHLMEVYINKVLTMKLICTPDELDALVVGRLYTEGIIASTGEIISLHICKYGNRADVIIDEEPAHDGSFVDTTPSCCTGNKLLNDLFRSNSLSPVSPIEYKDEWVYSLAEEFADATPLFLKTHSVHSAFLAQNGKTLYMSEDLGRHNALDKVIGKALIDGIDLKTSLLFTSGRVPTDMAEKAIRVGIPVLISKTVATDAAIELAREYNLTLLLKARPESFLTV